MYTLRKTNLVAAILTSFLLIFTVVFGIRHDEGFEQFLDSPNVRDKSSNIKHKHIISSQKQMSPLIQQTEDLSSCLNPKLKLPTVSPVRKSINIPRPPAVIPQFKLLGTSYCKSNPEMSLALIEVPGKGQRWFKQSSEVGHLRIEEIREGLITLKSSKEIFELTVHPNPEANKLK